MTELLTHSSGRVKRARRLLQRKGRLEDGLFLAEGWKAVLAAYDAGVLREVYATPAGSGALADAGRRLDVPIAYVDDRAMASLTDAVTPQGLVGVCRPIDGPLGEAMTGSLVVVCHDVRDPGNAGTIIRTADAAGADAVVLTGDSVDPYNPKAVRASVGSLFHVPLAIERDPAAVLRAARDHGLTVLATAADGEVDLYDAEVILRRPTAWLFGNEAHGLPEDLRAAADHRVAIPIHGRAESLNLAAAAAVCLYAGARARRPDRHGT